MRKNLAESSKILYACTFVRGVYFWELFPEMPWEKHGKTRALVLFITTLLKREDGRSPNAHH